MSKSFQRQVFVDDLRETDIEFVENAAREVPIGEAVEWDCQEYVLDVLDRLVEDLVLDEDDEDYKYAREDLEKQRGPV